MQKYNVGQMLEATENMTIPSDESNKEIVIKKGTKSWITASPDNLMLLTDESNVICFDDGDFEFVGFDNEGMAEFIFQRLKNRANLKNMTVCIDEQEKTFINVIAEALNDLGFRAGNIEGDE